MRAWVIVLAAAVAVAAAAGRGRARGRGGGGAGGKDMYTTEYDNVNVMDVLMNDRLFMAYFKCLMEEGPCTKDGLTLRRLLPEALVTNCAKCSEKQKKGAEQVIRFVMDKKPKEWERIEKKYDPNGVYRKRYAHMAG